jgi:hypothetical protein
MEYIVNRTHTQIQLIFATVIFIILSDQYAMADCTGCCSSHGGVVCVNGVTKCGDGTALSATCTEKGCNACTVTPDKPAVSTGSASAVTSSSATLNGTINPNGTNTTYYFEYGGSTGYGSSTASSSAGSGSTGTSVTANITGLNANTTYHFRLLASNTGGISYGSDATFTAAGSGGTTPTNPTATA